MLPAAPPRADASPGLLCRRYSVPETIMRKYRLAQQHSDSEASGAATHRSVASAGLGTTPDSPARFLRRDRELMRKSALLRRMWARPCHCCCDPCSLDGSRAELRPLSAEPRTAPAPWTSPKRQRLLAPDRTAATTANLSNSTFRSPLADRELSSYIETMTDLFTDSEVSRLGYGSESRVSPLSSEPVTAEPESEEPAESASTAPDVRCSGSDSDSFLASASTARETVGSVNAPLSSNGHIEGRISERSPGVDNDDRNMLPYERSPVAPAPPYELLEIVVSETVDAAVPPTRTADFALTFNKRRRNVNIDEYVSSILVESLNSLSDQLECMSASIGSDRKISIVEKEIKVKLQNTGVNTIVHLSPTSNNQIIFGNEELCSAPPRTRDECNNPLSIGDRCQCDRVEPERDEYNNNLVSELAFEPPLQHENVNRAVLQQIQKLFRDELRSLEEGERTADAPGVSHVEISNVDAYIDSHSEPGAVPQARLEIATSEDSERIVGVGAGNYFRDGDDAVAVPRFSAFPHTESMEVNTSSSSEGEAVYSDCTSLVDSLDDPNSPRAALVRRRGELARSAVNVLQLLPEGAHADPEPRGKAFFVRIQDGSCDHDPDSARVAECMPEKIKQKLYRRHRKREQRMESARRSKVKQLKKELERRRLDELARARRELERDCLAIVNALIDDVVTSVAHDEYKYMRTKRRGGKSTVAKSEENLAGRNRRVCKVQDGKDISEYIKSGRLRRPFDKENRKSERQIRGKLLARPAVMTSDRPPRRIYQKSEIHEGEKCIEILEILEYANDSQSSPESNSEESHELSSRGKKSRIPIPVNDRIPKTSKGDIKIRPIGDDKRYASPPPAGHLLAAMLLQALSEPARHSPPGPVGPVVPPGPVEPRSRSNSLRFKRVFDIIPEERSNLSLESAAEDAPPGRAALHSAGTSPVAEERARRVRSQTTMTSPCSRSAATSPVQPGPTRLGPARRSPARREGPPPRERVAPAQRAGCERAAGGGGGSSSDSGESGGSLLCSLAPRWLSAHARHRRRARRPPPGQPPGPPPGPPRHSLSGAPPLVDRGPGTRADSDGADAAGGAGGADGAGRAGGAGGWSVTVAGSCRAALPADVEMRLRFPHDRNHHLAGAHQACPCVACAACAACSACTASMASTGRGVAALPSAAAHRTPPHPPHPTAHHDGRLTLTMKKEAQDSSILASKSLRKSSEQLPELETYRASRTKLKSSVKTRRGYSLHCWLPDDEPAPIRVNNGLSVLGCAIIPELKPRVPTMSERDLTRIYTPRHYLRS